MLLALSDVTYVLIGWFKFLLLKFLYEYWPWSYKCFQPTVFNNLEEAILHALVDGARVLGLRPAFPLAVVYAVHLARADRLAMTWPIETGHNLNWSLHLHENLAHVEFYSQQKWQCCVTSKLGYVQDQLKHVVCRLSVQGSWNQLPTWNQQRLSWHWTSTWIKDGGISEC